MGDVQRKHIVPPANFCLRCVSSGVSGTLRVGAAIKARSYMLQRLKRTSLVGKLASLIVSIDGRWLYFDSFSDARSSFRSCAGKRGLADGTAKYSNESKCKCGNNIQ